MLRNYSLILDWLATLPPVIARIQERDRNLADHLRRSATRVCLSVAEGMGHRGGRRLNAYRIALAEMREACAAIEVAARLGFIDAPSEADSHRMRRIVGTLVLIAR